MFAIAMAANGIIPVRADTPVVPGWPIPPMLGGIKALFTAFERQDAIWFLRIASSGYAKGDGSAAFFPVFPAATKFVSLFVGGRPLLAATLVSNAAFLGALVVLYALTKMELSEGHARKAVLYLALFPTSFFFLAPYSESLFLLLCVSAFWFARRDRWGAAALVGLLAAGTRSIGIVIAPALLVEALLQWRERGVPLMPRAGAAVAVVLGPLSYLFYWQIRFADPWAPFAVQKQWQRAAVFPLQTLGEAITQARRQQGYALLDLLVVGVILLALVVGLAKLRPAYSFYGWLSLLVPLSYPFQGRALLSVPRFCVVLFPAFWVLADLSERGRLPHTAVVASFAGGLGLFAVLFINWWHIF